jgi:hypothetical protein
MSKGAQGAQHFRKWNRLDGYYDLLLTHNVCTRSVTKMKHFLSRHWKHLLLEMAVNFDLAPQFMRDITFLEGDSMLAPYITPRLNELETRFATFEATQETHINLHIIADKIAKSELGPLAPGIAARHAELIEYGFAGVRPSALYFERFYVGPHARHAVMVRAFRACQLWDPCRISDLYGHAAHWLLDLPFLNEAMRTALMGELPAYVALCVHVQGVGPDDLLSFFCRQRFAVPNWARVSKLVALLATSSAASERVFALANAMFSELEMSSLADRIAISIMLAYNERIATSTRKEYDLGLDQVPGYYAHLLQLPMPVAAVVAGQVPCVF